MTWFDRLIWVAFILVGLCEHAAAQTVLLAGTDKVAEVDVVLLNETTATIEYAVPDVFPAQVMIEGKVSLASLNRTSEAPTKLTLAAGSFTRVRYLVTDGAKLAGPASIQLIDHPAALTRVTLGDLVAPVSTESATESATGSATERAKKVTSLFRDPNYVSEGGLVEYLAYRFKPYEPIYFLAGDVDPMAKFQFSFKYQVFDPKGSIADTVPPLGNFYLAYSQTSFWDLEGESTPFIDNSYRPELFFLWTDLDDRFTIDGKRVLPEWIKLDVQIGVGHESNGRSGEESRSINRAFVRPTVTFGDRDDIFVSVGPRFFTYVGDLSDNPDVGEFIGDWVDLKMVAGQAGGVQLAAIGRAGNDWDKGSLQLDLSFPVRKLSGNSLDVFFHTQYFTGYSESLLGLRENGSSLRFGISLVR